MSIDNRCKDIIEEFSQFSNWEDRYKHLISLGKGLPEMPSEYKVEENKVNGCQSQVWLFATFNEGKIIFFGDSDAAIVKGIVGLLLRIYSDSTPEEILGLKMDFAEEIGLKQQLSMSRANGLASMLKQVQIYALAFQAKAKMGLA